MYVCMYVCVYMHKVIILILDVVCSRYIKVLNTKIFRTKL